MKKLTKKQKEHIKGMLKKLGYALMILGDVLLVFLIVGVLCVKSCNTKKQDNTPKPQEVVRKDTYRQDVNLAYLSYSDVPLNYYNDNTLYSDIPPVYADTRYTLGSARDSSNVHYQDVYFNYLVSVNKFISTLSTNMSADTMYQYVFTNLKGDYKGFLWLQRTYTDNSSTYTLTIFIVDNYVSSNVLGTCQLRFDSEEYALPYLTIASNNTNSLNELETFIEFASGKYVVVARQDLSSTPSNYDIVYKKLVFYFSSGSYRYVNLTYQNGVYPIDYNYSYIPTTSFGANVNAENIAYGLYKRPSSSTGVLTSVVQIASGDFYYEDNLYNNISVGISILSTSGVSEIRLPYGMVNASSLIAQNSVISIESGYVYFVIDKIYFGTSSSTTAFVFDYLLTSSKLNSTLYLQYYGGTTDKARSYASTNYGNVYVVDLSFNNQSVYRYLFKGMFSEGYNYSLVIDYNGNVVITGGGTSNGTYTGSLMDVMTFVDIGFSGLTSLLGYMILPGISIGLLISIPLVLTLLLVVIKLFKR